VLASGQAAKGPSSAEMIARTRAMIPALRARAPQGERDRRLPKETIAEMQAAGLFKVLQPKRWGGYELDVLTYFEAQMALGEADMSVAWVYGVVGVHPGSSRCWTTGRLRRSGARTTRR
jgi:3-hydroxy-9,10-secoandrosta-1,3,5(10)-triene-9,17-dione monooxygenase